ncbi:MAG: hypothetical protein ACO2Z9_09805, partial [Crocinitomicaceae bacterium]
STLTMLLAGFGVNDEMKNAVFVPYSLYSQNIRASIACEDESSTGKVVKLEVASVDPTKSNRFKESISRSYLHLTLPHTAFMLQAVFPSLVFLITIRASLSRGS